jgi:hypothetical protein
MEEARVDLDNGIGRPVCTQLSFLGHHTKGTGAKVALLASPAPRSDQRPSLSG